jgi:uncharacterized MAPEG superfamily protein
MDAYYAIAAAAVLIFVPHGFKAVAAHGKLKGGYNLKSPRVSTAAASDSTPEGQFITRCHGAHANAIENFPYLVAAVLMADLAGVPRDTTDRVAAAYLASRVVYTLLYMYGTTKWRAYSRSAVYIGGLASLGWLMALAAAARSSK